MSYCFNPYCQDPQNPGEGELCHHCGASVQLSVISGSENKCYRAVELLGQGGFGRTFLAVDQLAPNHPQVAIKQFFPPENNSTRAAELFRQEAQQLEILGQHPQIPRGVAYFEQDKYQYLVQEFIKGNNLDQELMLKGSFTENKIYQILDELLPVLQFIHSHKVIHRDIKPENIIRRHGDGKGLVLVDFGAAKLVTGGLLPKTGTLIGSAAYTAPEQLMGKAVFASDIYSLGVTCIHLLTGVSPFDLFDGHEGNWAWRSFLKTPVSEDLGNILDGMLAGAPSKRFHSAAAVLLKLHPQPQYIEAMPGLREGQETGFVAIAPPQVPVKPSVKKINNLSNKDTKIARFLEKNLTAYKVKIQVHRINKHQLTIVINRSEKHQVNYQKISKAIATELTKLNLNNIVKVKLLGRIKKRGVPEWQMSLRLDPKAKFQNKILRFQQRCVDLYTKFSYLKTAKYWRTTLKNKQFWMDGLLLAMVAYIFSKHLIIFTPLLSLIVAPLFLVVKAWTKQEHEIEENQLFTIIASLFICLGYSQSKFFINDVFGIIVAGLFVSIPLFYTRNN